VTKFFARNLIRWRWAVIVAWAVIGYLAAARAPHVVEVLNTRGGSRAPTEASRVDEILRTRCNKPLNDFFAVTLEAPERFDSGLPRELLDSLIARFERQRFVSGVVSFRSTGDSTFVSKDGKATVLLLGLVPAKGIASHEWCRRFGRRFQKLWPISGSTATSIECG
jgi:hypothetical protein